MAKYLFEYVTPPRVPRASRAKVARYVCSAMAKMTEGLGGTLETFDHAFGDVDLYAIADVPDSVSAAAIALAVSQGGGATVKTIVLIPPEDMDKAGKKTADYRPPGHLR